MATDIIWNCVFWIGWFLCFGFIFISAFIHTVKTDYFIWSAMSLFYFPLLFVVWQSRDDYDTLFRAIAWATIIGSLIFMIISVPGALIFDHSYWGSPFLGVVGNPNGNGRVAIAFFSAGLYLALRDEKTNVYALFAMAIAISLSVESTCRTAEFAILFSAFAGVVYYFKTTRNGIGEAIKKMILYMAALSVLTALLCLVLKTANSMDLFVYAATSDGVVSPETYNTLNILSSGRLDIWKYYTQDIKLLGHGIMDATGLPDAYRWAHNNLIDVLYISGAIAALGYIIWFFYAIVFVVKCVFSRTMKRPENLFVIASIIGYSFEAMLEVTIYPMSTGIVFMAFMSLALISGNNRKGICHDE